MRGADEEEQAERARHRRGCDEGPDPWLRVKVSNRETGCTVLNANIPLSLLSLGTGHRQALCHAPELEKIDLDQILAAVREGSPGKIIEVEDGEDQERVDLHRITREQAPGARPGLGR